MFFPRENNLFNSDGGLFAQLFIMSVRSKSLPVSDLQIACSPHSQGAIYLECQVRSKNLPVFCTDIRIQWIGQSRTQY